MTTENNQLSVQQENPFVRASTALSQQLGLEPRAMIDAIKTQFFKGKEATDAQLAVVVSTARALGLNPLLPGQLYPYPDRSGAVTIMLGPDGIFTLLANNPDIVAQKDGGPAYWTEHGKDSDNKATCTGYINHRTKGLLKKTIWVDEWAVSSNPNWSARKMHMSEIRALKQAARMVVHGIPPDSDEQKLSEMYNVTNSAESTTIDPTKAEATVTDRPAPKPRKGAAGAKNQPAEVVVEQEPAEQPKPVENIQEAMQAREEKVAKPEPVKEADPVKPTPRVFLKEGERLNATVKLDSITPVFMTVEGVRKACFKANVSGEFVGEVRSAIGTTQTGEKTMTVNPPFVAGAKVDVVLLGKMSAAPAGNPLHGKVLVWVEALQQGMTEEGE